MSFAPRAMALMLGLLSAGSVALAPSMAITLVTAPAVFCN